ncbi:hypothetical protein AQUCO_03500052v1 [Aquilegia coerulea]|uniref:F-box/LRR-repeat protein 15-like leucin rich repeat domain-containing protein n=1 Tax=Aquilegia coerulea TaxID=218851 RepID=A0A2G5CVU8_AQUCA|nr:hypothetical protein AQUCO_03500052v1 [Aquilegia coerulea]
MEKLENSEGIRVCINENLTDDELRAILSKLKTDKDKEGFGLVCKRWLHLQSTERKKLCARAGPLMLKKMAARFTHLIELDLSQSSSRSFFPGVTDSDLAVVAHGFDCLQILKLQNCKGVTDAGMVALGNGLSYLQSLDISHCRKVTDKGLEAIAKGCNLRSLNLAGCKFITDKLLQSLAENCSSLEELGLQGCNKITDMGLAILVNGCRQIKSLDVSKCNNVGNAGVSSVSKACSSYLLTFRLLDCYKIGDDSIFSLAQSCKNLETLVIGGCRDISDESLKSLVLACNHSLKYLRMDWCLNVSDTSLSCVLSQCRSLEALDIGCCEEITDMAFRNIGSEGFESRLKFLRVSNCPKITVSGIGVLLEACKSLEYLDVRSCPNVTKVSCYQAGLQFPDCCKVNFTGSLSELDAVVDIFL